HRSTGETSGCRACAPPSGRGCFVSVPRICLYLPAVVHRLVSYETCGPIRASMRVTGCCPEHMRSPAKVGAGTEPGSSRGTEPGSSRAAAPWPAVTVAGRAITGSWASDHRQRVEEPRPGAVLCVRAGPADLVRPILGDRTRVIDSDDRPRARAAPDGFRRAGSVWARTPAAPELNRRDELVRDVVAQGVAPDAAPVA